MKRVLTIIIVLFGIAGAWLFFTKGGLIKDWILDIQREASLPPALSYKDAHQEIIQPASPELQRGESASPPSGGTNTGEGASENLGSQNTDIVSPPPKSLNLDVPFTSQAPFAIWDEVHNEACEEASMMMVAKYKQGVSINSPEAADQELLQIVKFENEQLGFYKDTTAQETLNIARGFYAFKKSRLIYNPSVDDIKNELAAGNPVIAPAAGRILPNPYFKSPGPLYHMLVIRGYTADGKFITNDPGTRRGEGFTYTYDSLMNAIHDWNGGDVLNGQRVIIVLD
ncbi:MAG: hypothetical protein A3A80_00860 [Candidatus Terrybacteria bacterium RIFCSPLOWO2_01_FULL_44_24]|uniref:Peptidase C39-like domain-containing protein n=1 Tax=Candidatus Terrybacteria bacterium RIFCSPHIGHO2_01_FULL_43_35 TaxID=1802361 RepID=A0A1G2PH42_9BACT|nr:MAG: hypothetical protein A2828_02765 [Candidatus Terrybacteria bacterium RIFCSPHIGHO2_01_FULL_43_35]OHA49579.1 MAG: hypothetical protein A3B75_01425 [Candidatus Terrybacteria bacterium RIFCSPHIGHO2_02_FULL_43_14]OHA51871.1 MAG: hypothetical protein A3A80_00860 [Candidatus Terrybacteria bacterium RIFCSPLOWO2_01_FULL_44_24]